MIEKDISLSKIKRKKFFLYSGAAVFGIFSIIKNPLKILNSAASEKDISIKIIQNPNAVKRSTGQVNNG